MAVKKKGSKTKVDEVIGRGGKTVSESEQNKRANVEVRFTLRISEELIDKIDADRESRIGNVSRNQWILEAIAKRLT